MRRAKEATERERGSESPRAPNCNFLCVRLCLCLCLCALSVARVYMARTFWRALIEECAMAPSAESKRPFCAFLCREPASGGPGARTSGSALSGRISADCSALFLDPPLAPCAMSTFAPSLARSLARPLCARQCHVNKPKLASRPARSAQPARKSAPNCCRPKSNTIIGTFEL